jgi:hypothetical protein
MNEGKAKPCFDGIELEGSSLPSFFTDIRQENVLYLSSFHSELGVCQGKYRNSIETVKAGDLITIRSYDSDSASHLNHEPLEIQIALNRQSAPGGASSLNLLWIQPFTNTWDTCLKPLTESTSSPFPKPDGQKNLDSGVIQVNITQLLASNAEPSVKGEDRVASIRYL